MGEGLIPACRFGGCSVCSRRGSCTSFLCLIFSWARSSCVCAQADGEGPQGLATEERGRRCDAGGLVGRGGREGSWTEGVLLRRGGDLQKCSYELCTDCACGVAISWRGSACDWDSDGARMERRACGPLSQEVLSMAAMSAPTSVFQHRSTSDLRVSWTGQAATPSAHRRSCRRSRTNQVLQCFGYFQAAR